ncbi:cell wall / vacuolar inhibitor of fructosidase 2-like [Capsicum annuum]|uniref:cell wall / vacuolar inhibitor of fructosidase 2-like n=1 Tax=Capsicum annuum TaxID=4072 RepID=UPI001FB0A6E3|nr:cell wall / vacuolar inhibitor of fructosidase 2-like [Capsicum annuum]
MANYNVTFQRQKVWPDRGSQYTLLSYVPLFVRYRKCHLHFSMFNKGTSYLIDDACHRTGDFNLCAASLRTDPHIRTADIKGLTCIMMEMCLDKAKGISSQIERIIKQATDRGFKECLEICLKEFGLAIDNHLPYAIKQLDSGDYVDATYSLMGVDNSAET